MKTKVECGRVVEDKGEKKSSGWCKGGGGVARSRVKIESSMAGGTGVILEHRQREKSSKKHTQKLSSQISLSWLKGVK